MAKSSEKTCQKHPKNVMGISATELARLVSRTHYKYLANFLWSLADNIYLDSQKDFLDGKKQLAIKLKLVSTHINRARKQCEKAWLICKPYIED